MKTSKIILGMALPILLLSACGGRPAESKTSDSFDINKLSNQFIVHFHSDEKKYDEHALWLWPKNGSLNTEFPFIAEDSFGGISASDLSLYGSDPANLEIGVIVKTKGSWSWQTKDRFVSTAELTPDSRGNYSVWIVDGDDTIYSEEITDFEKVRLSYFVDFNTLFVSAGGGKAKKVELLCDGEVVQEYSPASPSQNVTMKLEQPVDLHHVYSAQVTFESGVTRNRNVQIHEIYNSASFKETYDYDGELGAIYASDHTLFKVWSPYSDSIKLKLYRNGTPTSVSATKGSDEVYLEVPMTQGEKGVWSATVNEDLEGFYYTYEVVSSAYPKGIEVVDPYARSAGINGLRGMVVDFSKTNPEGWDEVAPKQTAPTSSVIYEAHVADITSSPTWNGPEEKAKRFAGLIETGTAYTNDDGSTPTGFDYLKTLGFNALQLQPIFDQANDEVNPSFNWGYNPLNYNVLEGSYSSDPYDGYVRIKEFKEVVQAYAKEGINIIMDVVYNHVNSVNGQNFDVLVPDYYFRKDSEGVLTNGSGCGNETADEHTMFQKFVIDSTKFWANEYKLGGFRFDLMGLHQIATMNAVTAALKESNPSVCVIGEPWAGGTSGLNGIYKAADQKNIGLYEGYGAFNDQMRDGLVASGMNGPETLSYVMAPASNADSKYSAHLSAIKRGLAGGTGMLSDDPAKAVQYVTCHDNRVLKDRFLIAKEKKPQVVTFGEEDLPHMSTFAQSFAMLSQGISFMQEGEEFLRTKGGSENSYGGDPLSAELKAKGYSDWYQVNALDYALAIENADMVEVYKDLINLKVSQGAFHKATPAEAKAVTVSDGDSRGQILVDLADASGDYRIAFANGFADPATVDFEGYTLLLDTRGINPTLNSATPMVQYQTLVARKTA